LRASGACSKSYDENIATSEFVRIDFASGPYLLRRLGFAGETPADDIAGGLVRITTGLGAAVSVATLTFAEARRASFGAADWVQFDFVNTEFVVSSLSDVPVPGALPLLLTGILGFGAAAARRRRA
jgi:hypothetical protein